MLAPNKADHKPFYTSPCGNEGQRRTAAPTYPDSLCKGDFAEALASKAPLYKNNNRA